MSVYFRARARGRCFPRARARVRKQVIFQPANFGNDDGARGGNLVREISGRREEVRHHAAAAAYRVVLFGLLQFSVILVATIYVYNI